MLELDDIVKRTPAVGVHAERLRGQRAQYTLAPTFENLVVEVFQPKKIKNNGCFGVSTIVGRTPHAESRAWRRGRRWRRPPPRAPALGR